MDNAELLNNPLFSSLSFYSDLSALAKAFKGKDYGKILLVSSDEEYLPTGKQIKDVLELSGLFVSVFVAEERLKNPCTLFSRIIEEEKPELLLAVGKEALINECRVAAKNTKIFALPTKLILYPLFLHMPQVEVSSGIKRLPAKQLDKIFIVGEAFKGLKKHDYADCFCSVAGKIANICDYFLSAKLFNREYNKNAVDRLFKAVDGLVDLNNDNLFKHLLYAQLNTALAFCIDENLCYGGADYVGYVLSNLKSTSVSESVFLANEPIIDLYEAFYGNEIVLRAPTANYNAMIVRLSVVLGRSENELYKNYEPFSYSEIKALMQKPTELDISKNCKDLVFTAKKAYKKLYKGRQKRADFSLTEFKTALYLGGYFDNGFYKILLDSGVLECFI